MEKQRVFRASAFVIFLTLLLLPGVAHANNVAVNCPAGSLNGALAALPPNGPNTVTVTGTCNEDVSITDMRSLTIVTGNGVAQIVQPQDSNTFDIVRSQNIVLQGLQIVGVAGSTPGFGGGGVNIDEVSDVQILGCDIHDNQGGGVIVNRGSLLQLLNTNIHNNTPGDGLDVIGKSIANVATTTIQNNGCAGLAPCFNFGFGGGVGVFVQTSNVTFRRNNLIQNNGDIGIWARVGSAVGIGGDPTKTTTIQGHNITGILIQEGAHLGVSAAALIQGNGGGCPPQTPIPCGGIFATENAAVEFGGGVGTVTGNHGAGITVQQGTNLHLGGGATVSNNSGDGVDIRLISIGDFTAIPGSGFGTNTITGNGGASVFCDARSLVIGNLTGLSNVKCSQNSQN